MYFYLLKQGEKDGVSVVVKTKDVFCVCVFILLNSIHIGLNISKKCAL